MGELRDRAMALAALAEAFGLRGRDMTPVRIDVYDQALADIPVPLLNAAVRRAIQTRTWFPKVAELRMDAELCRRELLEAHPYERCAACNHLGTVRIGTVGGKPQYGRCKCWTAYQERLSTLGVTEKPLAQLTAGTQPEADMEPVAIDDLPPAITDSVRTLASRKTW